MTYIESSLSGRIFHRFSLIAKRQPEIPKTHSLRFSDLLLSAAVLTSVVSGCASTASAPPGSHASASDLSFVTNLYNVVDFDHQVTGELLTKSPDPRVAALARDLVAQGDRLEAQVAPIAEGEGILPPKGQRFTQRADLQVKIASVMGSNPLDYDREYLADEVYSHEQALESVRKMAREPAVNPQFVAISAEATGVLQANLVRLKKLQTQMLADSD